jgi:hypothetical protein
MARGPYKDVQFTDFSGGLNTRIDNNLIADNQSPDLQNVIFDGQGSIMPRMGNIIFGATTSATGRVRRAWVTVNRLDKEVPIRQIDNGTNCWLEYYNPHTTAWEILDDGYTTGLDFGTAYYDNYTYYCSQKDWQRRWNGTYHSVSALISAGHTSCALSVSAASALGFLSAGSVVIDGEEVYYLSANGKTLHTTAFTGVHAANSDIAQLPTSAGETPAPDGGWCSATSTLPRGSIMYEMDAQIFVTGASGVSGNIVYYSAVDEPVNYAISAKPGGGGTARYPETTGSIRCLTEFDQVLTVLKENTIRQLKFNTYADGTAGSLEIVTRNNILTAPKSGALNNKGAARVENDTTFVAPSGWIKSLSKIAGNVTQTNELSLNIRPTVESLDFSRAVAIYYDGKYYVACSTTDSTYNNRVLIYDYAFRAWSKYVGWNVNDWFIYEGALHYAASNEIAVYRALYNYDDNGYVYTTYWNSKWFDFGVPNEQKRLGLVYIEGYCTSNTDIGVSAYFDGDASTIVSKTIDGANTNYVTTSDTLTVIGQNIWGQGLYGGGTGGSSFTLNKFRWWGRYSGRSFYNMQIKIGTANPGYVYKITHLAPYLDKVPGKKTPPASII